MTGVYLDPLKRIVGVGWAPQDTAILAIYLSGSTYSFDSVDPAIWSPLTLSFGGSDYSLADAPSAFVGTGSPPPITQIVTSAMRRAYKLWSYPVFKNVTLTTTPASDPFAYVSSWTPDWGLPDWPPDGIGKYPDVASVEAAIDSWGAVPSHTYYYNNTTFTITSVPAGTEITSNATDWAMLSFINLGKFLKSNSPLSVGFEINTAPLNGTFQGAYLTTAVFKGDDFTASPNNTPFFGAVLQSAPYEDTINPLTPLEEPVVDPVLVSIDVNLNTYEQIGTQNN